MYKPEESKEVSVREIVAYWEQHQEETGLGVDWADAHKRCWRCGYVSRRLQKCHITPRSRKGPASASNLVLLCCRCHRAAPNIVEPKYMWIWLRTTSFSFYDTFILAEAVFEFEKMYGRKPFHGLNEKKFRAMLQKGAQEASRIFNSTVVHFGEGRRNAATLACIFAQLEESEMGVAPKPRESSWLTEYLTNDTKG